MKRFSAVWFDLDGTLCDTAQGLIPAVQATVQAAGFVPQDSATIRAALTFGSKKILATALGDAADDGLVEKLLPDFHDRYMRSLAGAVPLFNDMENIIERLNTQAIPWGIVTNKLTRFTRVMLSHQPWWQATQTLVCGDTLALAKPHPEPLLYACKTAQVAPEHCVFIGDSRNDMLAGKAAQMTTIACAYGYLPQHENAHTWPADYVIDAPLSLSSLLFT